jgi:hypothetical protein
MAVFVHRNKQDTIACVVKDSMAKTVNLVDTIAIQIHVMAENVR